MWSHSINDGSIGGGESDTPQDSFCRSCDKASSDDDVRQVFNLSAVYQLPFGAGKHYLSSPGVARTILGGWTLSAIATAQTGLPVNITITRSNGSVPGDFAISGEERPNWVPGVSLTPPGGSTPQEWINPAAFSMPAAGTFGDLGRNAFRAPGISDVDLALAKDVSFAERVKLRFGPICSTFSIAPSTAPPTPTYPRRTSASSPARSAAMRRDGARRGSFSFRPRYRFSADPTNVGWPLRQRRGD